MQCMYFLTFLCLDSEAEWESLNQDWLTLAKFRSVVMKKKKKDLLSCKLNRNTSKPIPHMKKTS